MIVQTPDNEFRFKEIFINYTIDVLVYFGIILYRLEWTEYPQCTSYMYMHLSDTEKQGSYM